MMMAILCFVMLYYVVHMSCSSIVSESPIPFLVSESECGPCSFCCCFLSFCGVDLLVSMPVASTIIGTRMGPDPFGVKTKMAAECLQP